jgi:hypothetical protein
LPGGVKAAQKRQERQSSQGEIVSFATNRIPVTRSQVTQST